MACGPFWFSARLLCGALLLQRGAVQGAASRFGAFPYLRGCL